MYKTFEKLSDGGYRLLKQGKISVYIIGTALILFSLFLLKLYLVNSPDKTLLYGSCFMLLFALIVFRRLTVQCIFYPNQKLLKYSSGFGASEKEYKFEDFDGFITYNSSTNAIKTGNALKMGFYKNGKIKELVLGANISAKKIRLISEEITTIMNEK